MSSTARGPQDSHPYIFGKKNINFSPTPASTQGVKGDVHSAASDFFTPKNSFIPDDDKVIELLLSPNSYGFKDLQGYYLSHTDLGIVEDVFNEVVFKKRKDDVESLVLYCNDDEYPMVRYNCHGEPDVDFSQVEKFINGYGGKELDEMIEKSQALQHYRDFSYKLHQLTDTSCLSYERIRQGFTQRAESRNMVFYDHDFDVLATDDYSSPAFKNVMSSLINSSDIYWEQSGDTVVLGWDQVDKWLDSGGFNALVSAWDLSM